MKCEAGRVLCKGRRRRGEQSSHGLCFGRDENVTPDQGEPDTSSLPGSPIAVPCTDTISSPRSYHGIPEQRAARIPLCLRFVVQSLQGGAMASLVKTNTHLRNLKRLARRVAHSVYESSVFEGASPRALSSLRSKAAPPSSARAKKSTKAR